MKTKKTSALLLSVFLGVLLLGSSAVNTTMAQDEGPPLPLKGDVTVDFNFGFDSSWTSGPTPQNLDPTGLVGDTFWYNVTNFDSPLDDILTGTPLGGGPVGIEADFEGSQVSAKILRQEGPVYDCELAFYLANDIVFSLDLSQAGMPISIPSLSNFTIPGEILIPIPIAVTSFGNWSEFDALMDSPMGDQGMGPVLPGIVVLDGDSWDDNYDFMSSSMDRILNESIGTGVTVDTTVEMNSSGLFLELGVSGFDDKNNPVTLEVSAIWAGNSTASEDGILESVSFYFSGDFDGNGWVSTTEYIDFLLERDHSQGGVVGLPISTGDSGSVSMAAGLDILLTGDIATIADQMGISSQISLLESYVDELDGIKFAEFNIGDMDGLFYEMHGEVTDIFWKIKSLFGGNGGGAGEEQIGYPKMPFSTVVNGYDGMKYVNTTQEEFLRDRTWVQNGFTDYEDRCDVDEWGNYENCKYSIRADSSGIVQIEPSGHVVDIIGYMDSDFIWEDWEKGMPPGTNPIIPIDWWYEEIEKTWYDEWDGIWYSENVTDLFIEFNSTDLYYEGFPGEDGGSWTEPMVLIFTVQRIPGYRSYLPEFGILMGSGDNGMDSSLASNGSLLSMVQIPGMPEIPGPDPKYIFGTFLVPAPALTPEWEDEESVALLADAILDKAESLINELLNDDEIVTQLKTQGIEINYFNLTADISWDSTTNDAGVAAYEMWSELNLTADVRIKMQGDESSSESGPGVEGDVSVEFYLASSDLWLQSGVFDSSFIEGSVDISVDLWEIVVPTSSAPLTNTTTTQSEIGGGAIPGFEILTAILVLATVPAMRALRRKQ